MNLLMKALQIPPYDDDIVKAYHGTSLDLAKEIIEKQEVKQSKNPYDWLGHGSYFWEDSYERAQHWAEERFPENPAVIYTKIKLGHCLNLLNLSWHSTIKRAHDELSNQYQAKGKKLPTNNNGRRALDCAVINYIADNYYEVDTVRAAYLEGESAYLGGLFVGLAHIQLVVRNIDMVVGTYDIIEG